MSNSKRRKTSKSAKSKSITPLQEKLVNLIGVAHLTKFVACGKEFWEEMNNSERVEMMIRISKRSARGTDHPLYRCLNQHKLTVLNGIYKKHVGVRKIYVKNVLIWEILGKFYGEDTPMEKKEQERSNMKDLDEMVKGMEHIEMCDVLLPIEITRQILDFVPKNFQNMVNVGAVCKLFYILLLSSFDTIKISKENLSTMSVFALKNAKAVEIGHVLIDCIPEIFKMIDPNSPNLTTLSINPTFFNRTANKYALNILTGLSKILKKEKNVSQKPLQNITRIVVEDWNPNCYSVRSRQGAYNLLKIFPKLQSVGDLKGGIKSLNLLFNESEVSHITELSFSQYQHHYLGDAKPKYIFPFAKKFSMTKDNPTNLQRRTSFNFYERLLAKSFPSLEFLSIGFKVIPTWEARTYLYNRIQTQDTRKISIDDFLDKKVFSGIPKLRKFEFRENAYRLSEKELKSLYAPSTRRHEFSPVPVYIAPIIIEEFIIVGSLHRSYEWYCLDLSFIKLMENNFFFGSTIGVFRGELPLCSRTWKMKNLQLFKKKERRKVKKELKNFLKFLCEGLEYYKIFDLKIATVNSCFADSSIRFIFEKKKRRIRVRYRVEDEKVSGTSMTTVEHPCGYLLRNFVRKLKKLVSIVDIFEFSVVHKREEWRDYVGKKVLKMEDFGFERDGLCVLRKYMM